MKHVALIALALASGTASAFCPPPQMTGNAVYDNYAQQQFYMCLNQQRQQSMQMQQQPAYPQAGQINFGLMDTTIPAQIGNAAAEAIRQRRMMEQMQR